LNPWRHSGWCYVEQMCKKVIFPFCSMLHWLVMPLQILHVILYCISAWLNFQADTIAICWQYKVHVLKNVFQDFACLTMHTVYSK